jgi:uncharacterized protein (TIGR03437 family)
MGRILICSFAFLAGGMAACWGQTVPAAYTDLYTQLSGNLTDFTTDINAVWNGSPNPAVVYAGQLTDANSNTGPKLLLPSAMNAIQTELLVLKAVGVKAVSVEVSFPMLYAPFLESVQPGYQQQFATFYGDVAAAVRAQGFQLIVESQSIDHGSTSLQSNAIISALPAFYSSLNLSQYIAARAATAAVVARTMKPDYFILQEEPDTEGENSGLPLGQVADSTTMLNATHAAVAGLVPGMKVGAGFGSWLGEFQRFANSFTRTACSASQPCVTTPLDFLDMHVFPIIENAVDCETGGACPSADANFQKNTLAMMATAKTAGIPMTISQCWLRKVRDSEWSILPGGGSIEEAREAYSFWAPLDQRFLQAVYDLANYQGMYFLAPFNTQNYSAYLTWSSGNAISGDCGSGTSPCGSLAPNAVFADVQLAAAAAVQKAQYTSTGQAWHNLIAPGDVTPPSQPGSLSATVSASSANLRWSPSTDDVGVAGYQVWRNGVQAGTVFGTYFQDSGLTANTAYAYQVKAFDLASNISAAATVAVTTLAANQIVIGSVTNGASFAANSICPGAIATIFGTGLATSTAPATSVPLPTTLGGASVAVNGIVAALFYASPTQINFQVPGEIAADTAGVVVSVGGASNAPFSASVQAAAPGIFQFGTNRAVAVNPDQSVNDSDNPVAAGSYIVAYLTGIGPVENPVADGVPAPDAPLSNATSPFSATIGGQNAPVFFLGLTPGFVGLAQANITIPALSSGTYPLVITVNGVASNGPLVTVSGSSP